MEPVKASDPRFPRVAPLLNCELGIDELSKIRYALEQLALQLIRGNRDAEPFLYRKDQIQN